MSAYPKKKLPDIKSQLAAEALADKLGTLRAGHPKLAALKTIVPFDQYAFSGIDYPGLGVGGGVILASDMPFEFLQAFLDQGLYRVDPLSSLITPSMNWGSWHDLSAADLSRPELQPIRLLESKYKVSTRSVVVFYRGAVRCGGASFTRKTPFTDKEKLILEAVAKVVHLDLSSEYILRMSRHAGLNAGEISCLSAVASGLDLAAASVSTGFKPETVTSYIKSATKKLGASNRTHAVAEAMRRRLIY